jgi:hypothetical protein
LCLSGGELVSSSLLFELLTDELRRKTSHLIAIDGVPQQMNQLHKFFVVLEENEIT